MPSPQTHAATQPGSLRVGSDPDMYPVLFYAPPNASLFKRAYGSINAVLVYLLHGTGVINSKIESLALL